MKKIFFLVLVICLNVGYANAQWLLTGNAIASGNFLGTTNAFDLIFQRNNIQSGLLNTSNTSFGVSALNASSTGTNNTAMGVNALFSNTTASNNVAIGQTAMYSTINGGYNVAIGQECMYNNTSGGANVAIGASALVLNTTGGGNVAIGNDACAGSNLASYNVGVGSGALASGNGSYNTATGAYSLSNSNTGNYNVANGYYALYYNTSGVGNTAVGYESLYSNNAGSYNTGLGYNTYCGFSLTNTTVIGNGATVAASNNVVIGNSSVTKIGGYVGWSNISDGRVKKDIQTNVPGLTFINKLTPITYSLDLDAIDKIAQVAPKKDKDGNIIPLSQDELTARKQKEQIVQTGFIAQDVEKAAKSLGYNFSGVNAPANTNDLYSLTYSDFVVPLVKAVQELSSKNDSLQSTNTQQQQKIDTLQQQFNDLKNTISQMQSAMSHCCNSFASSMQSATLDKPAIGNLDQPSLSQNAPNPYNSSTIIGYHLPVSTGSAQLLVTDINGQELKTITLTGTGNGQITINAGTLTSGNYFYTLIVDGQKVDTKQMVLTK